MGWTAQVTVQEDQGDGKTHLHAEGADIVNTGDDQVTEVDIAVSPQQTDDYFKPGQKFAVTAAC